MLTQCDIDGNDYLFRDVLVDYCKDNKAISLIDQQVSIQNRPVTHKTNASWKIWCQWKDGSTSWEKLSKLKDSHPVQTVEFAVAQQIDHEPSLNWWVKHVLKKRDIIIASIRKQQTRYLKKSHKCDIELPKGVEQDLTLDAKDDNTLLADAISYELENVRVPVEILRGNETPKGHQFV